MKSNQKKSKLILNAMDEKTLDEFINIGKINMTCIFCNIPVTKDKIKGLKGNMKQFQVICNKHVDYVWEKAMQYDK